MPTSALRVLCVDLDGTLVATDLLWESLMSVLRTRPWALLAAPYWLLRGRAYLKRRLAEQAAIDFTTLPYRQEVLAFVDRERRRGRRVVLATAADQVLADGVSAHLGFFSAVIASDGVTNLKGRTKAASLVDRFGRGNFDYIGNSRTDIPIWESAGTAISTASSGSSRIPHLHTLNAEPSAATRLRLMLAALRPHQWVKNLLIFVPTLAAHRFDAATLALAFLAFATFSLVASGGYVLNDLLDVGADRLHHRKRRRPFASGQLPLSMGVALVGVMWTVGFALAGLLLPGGFSVVLAIYLGATAAYSLKLKREPVVDVMVLAGLYVIRVIAGGVATDVPVSSWLLAFTLFVSLSLAYMKRFIEVKGQEGGDPATAIPGRGYLAGDAAWLHSAGIASAYLSVVILALYANSADVTRLYTHPERLVLICPLMLFWATRIWLHAHRQQLHDDPIVAMALDPATYVVAVTAGAIVLLAA